jgi:hypothetical protein
MAEQPLSLSWRGGILLKRRSRPRRLPVPSPESTIGLAPLPASATAYRRVRDPHLRRPWSTSSELAGKVSPASIPASPPAGRMAKDVRVSAAGPAPPGRGLGLHRFHRTRSRHRHRYLPLIYGEERYSIMRRATPKHKAHKPARWQPCEGKLRNDGPRGSCLPYARGSPRARLRNADVRIRTHQTTRGALRDMSGHFDSTSAGDAGKQRWWNLWGLPPARNRVEQASVGVEADLTLDERRLNPVR